MSENDDFWTGFPGEMNEHLTAQRIQELLDGQLPERELADVQEHVVFCARCQSELEAWQLLYSELGGLTEMEPSPHFAARVLERFPEPEAAAPFGQRVRSWLVARGKRAAEHLSPERLQDYVDGVIPDRQMARIDAHVEGCTACRAEVSEWQGLFAGLGTLQTMEPSDGFYERVMAQHRVLQLVQAWEPVSAQIGALAWAKRLIPRTRRAWAMLAGVATAPLTIMGVLLFEMFSNPALTPGYLGSFLTWKVTEWGAALGSAFLDGAFESTAAFQAYSAIDFLSGSPLLAVGGALSFGALSVSAAWVLYTNLFRTRSTEHPYAQASV